MKLSSRKSIIQERNAREDGTGKTSTQVREEVKSAKLDCRPPNLTHISYQTNIDVKSSQGLAHVCDMFITST